ncbi:hypothetical protein AB0A77_02035 [Streptomyces varsoviensis]|uniref:hypothetical protein n=1 Tax=Streptomyces varsoviensis TaxID=67373 RepID=UPI003401018F
MVNEPTPATRDREAGVHMTGPQDRVVRDALWRAVLAFGGALPKPSSYSRTEGDYANDGEGSRAYRATFSIGQEDGTSRVFKVTVSAAESVDSADDFWTEHSPHPDIWHQSADCEPERRVVVDGQHYVIGPGNSGGFGGRRFDIEFFDGRRVTTRDLWSQGAIPPKHRRRYPDNARFVPVEGPKWEALSGAANSEAST